MDNPKTRMEKKGGKEKRSPYTQKHVRAAAALVEKTLAAKARDKGKAKR